jgi:hypothetical protein
VAYQGQDSHSRRRLGYGRGVVASGGRGITNAPKTGLCYCGCRLPTGGYFATNEGHDGQAASMLHFLKWGTTNIAEILREEGFGPGPENRNLRAEATAAGWKPRAEQ